MSKQITNNGVDYVSLPIVGRRFAINNQEYAAPGQEIPLTDQQESTESVKVLISDGKLEDTDKGVKNVTDSYQSFPTDWKNVDVTHQLVVAPGENVVITDEQAESTVIKRLVDEGVIECEDAPEPEIEGKGYSVTLDKESYSLSGSSTLSIKATVVPDDGDLSPEDKQGWVADSKSNRLDFTDVSWSTKGVATFKMKRNDGTSLKSFADTVTIKRDGEVFATAQVAVKPSVTILVDSTDKLVTDGVFNVTAIKLNGTAVEQDSVEISAKTADIATVKFVGGKYAITPVSEGTCHFDVSNKSGSYDYQMSVYAPACKIGNVYYKTIAAALKAVQSGDVVILDKDVIESVSFSGQAPREQGFALSIDLNGHIWTGEAGKTHTLRQDYGTMTLIDTVGTGKVLRGKGYAFVVSHLAGDYEGKLVIDVPNTTEFTGVSCVLQCGTTGGVKGKSNYNYYGGDVVIKGGRFVTTADPSFPGDIDEEGRFGYTLNYLDMTAANGYGANPDNPLYPSSISVQGGVFANFDPSNCKAEGVGTNFVADGYVSEKQGDDYTVVAAS